jgi:MFS family permease
LADLHGRKWPFYFSLVVALITHIGLVFSRNITNTIFLFFIFGGCCAGRYSICYGYLCELMPDKYKDYVGSFVQFSDASTFIVLVVYFRFISKDWLPFQIFAIGVTTACIIGTYFIPESPRDRLDGLMELKA